MRSHERRLERLERRHVAKNVEPARVSVIFVDKDGQPVSGTMYGTGVIIDREPGESVEAFKRRVDALGVSR